MSRPPNASRQTHLLLRAMLEQPRQWRYGYEPSKATGLSSGTLYPLLIRLSDQGLMDSKWQETERAGRPPRHVYRLSARGVQLARTADDIAAPEQVHARRKGSAIA